MYAIQEGRMDWKQIINDVLEHQKFTQASLSEKTGISKSYICELKNGKRKSPSFEMGLTLVKLHPNKKELLK